jgi:AcrR family transcriptional regulator
MPAMPRRPKASTASRKPYHHGDLRHALLKAATDIVRTRGLPELSLRAVARKARVSHAAPYHHFPDRTALVAAVAEQGFVGLKRSMDAQLRGLGNARDRLEAAGVGYVLFAVRNPTHFRLMFSAEFEDKSRFPELGAAARAAHGVLTQLATECQAAGLVRAGDPHLISLAMWAIVHGLAILLIDRQFGFNNFAPGTIRKLTADVKYFLWVGLAPDRVARP